MGSAPAHDASQLWTEALALYRAGRFEQARSTLSRLIELAPRHADGWHLLGMTSRSLNDDEQALGQLQRAVELDANNPSYYNNLGTLHEARRDYAAAERCLRAALSLKPDYVVALANLGEVYKAQGLLRQALDHYRQALQIDPGFFICRSNLLAVMNYDPQATREQLLDEHQRWGALAAARWPRVALRLRGLDPDRRLRIGYISPDFRRHAVMRFFEPVLAAHDRQTFEIFLYAELPHPDDVSRRLATYPATWRQTVGRSAQDVARMVQEDRIDILVDLAGHTAHHRLDVLACKPAPLQATWLGYSNTTGLSTVDYRISDAVVDPPAEPTWSSEQVLRLPASFACFRPPDGAPDCAPSPAAQRGWVTFGSHHPPIKLNEPLLRLWQQVLEAVPTARLCFVRDQFSPELVERWQQRVADSGIDLARVEFRAPSIAEQDYLSCFADIDVVLDSTPFNGHTMTCEALWMGVPVVTLRGERPMGRLSASVLTALGREEWIANTPEDYVARAAALAGDVEQLQHWRTALRPLVQSRLGDGPRLTRELESLYRRIWSDYCRDHAAAHHATAPLSSSVRLPAAGLSTPADWNQRGLDAVRRGDLGEAKRCFEQAVRLEPGYANGWTNLGHAEKRLGRLAEAERCYLAALSLEPASADIHWSLGQLRQLLHQTDEALVSFQHAVRLRPDWSRAHCSLARLLALLGRGGEALEVCERAHRQGIRNVELEHEHALALDAVGRTQEALEGYRRAIALDAKYAPAQATLAFRLADEGDCQRAITHYEAAFAAQPSARIQIAMQTMLPPVYESAEAVQQWRTRLTNNLAQMQQTGVRLDPTQEIFPTLFYLAYQGLNDRPPAESLAALAIPRQDQPPRFNPRTSGKIRIGFLSKYLRDHTIGRLNLGLIAGLDRAHFEVTVLSIGGTDDRLGARIRRAADRFVTLPPDLPTASQRVADARLDILYFPEIGMDPLTYTLAFQRFAPVQCATWGHPVTSGLKTIDYFLSSRDLETADSADFWTEQAIALPSLGVCYERPETTNVAPERGEFGLPPDGNLYLCPQTLFKFHPDFDNVLRAILESDSQGWLVLLEGNHRRWTELLKQRFARALGAAAERVRFLPGQPRPAYLRLLQLADCVLDPLHFGGGNSSYECFAVGAPVVTRPSAYLRGRLTYAMYRQMELGDLIAADDQAYVRLAVRLGTDGEFRAVMRQRILERAPVLFSDVSAIRAIEGFFRQAVETANSTRVAR